jgi:hypothetical protein
MRTRVMTAMQVLELGHGVRRGAALWSGEGQATVASLALAPHAADRRTELQAMYRHLNTQIDALIARRRRPVACPSAHTHPGSGR